MKLVYLTLPLGVLAAGSGIWILSAASVAPALANSPSTATKPIHPVTLTMSEEAAERAGSLLPEFSAIDTNGKGWTFSSLSRGKPVYMVFILDGCPCSTGAEPLFHELYKRFKGKINFVGVIDADKEEAAKWARDHETPYTVLADPHLNLIHSYKIPSAVYNVLILPDRTIDTLWPGYSQDMLMDMNARMAAVLGLSVKPFDPLYAPLAPTSGCFFPI